MMNFFVMLGLAGLVAPAAIAGENEKLLLPADDWPFNRGNWDFEAGAGYFGSFSTTAAKRVTVDYQMEDLRLGWIYDNPRHNGLAAREQ